MEHVGPAQHRQRRQIAPERPTPDAHPTEVEPLVAAGQGGERVDLVVEHRSGQVAPHLPFPGGPPGRRPPAVHHHHGEALVGEPL